MHKPFRFLIIIFLLVSMTACRQPGDTHTRVISRAINDNSQINKLITKGKGLMLGNADSLLIIAQQLNQAGKTHNNKSGLLYAQVFEAEYYWMITDYPHAIPLALQSLTDAEKWGIKKPVPEIYLIIANIHKENGNYTAAFKDADNGLTAAKQNRDTASIISLLGLKAMFTHGYYRKNGHPQDDHSSLGLEFEALKIAESQPKFEKTRIKFYNNIAQTYKEKGDYNNTLLYAHKAIELADKYHQLRSLTYSYNWLGEAYYNMGQHEKGIAYLDTAIAIARRVNLPYRQMEIYEAMHWCYMSTKSYQLAIASLNRFTKMRDSLQIAKNEKQISELQLKYETVKKDRQIALLGQQNTDKSHKILWISIGMFFFVVLLFVILRQYFTIHRYSKLMENNNQRLNDALLKIAHIQSHQIRRPLASILGLMNIIKAHDYHPDKEVLQKMDKAAQELDQRIRDVIRETEIGD